MAEKTTAEGKDKLKLIFKNLLLVGIGIIVLAFICCGIACHFDPLSYFDLLLGSLIFEGVPFAGVLIYIGTLCVLLGIIFHFVLSERAVTETELQDGYCGLAKHVLLLLFTFGIWQLIWVYKTTVYLNQAKGEEYRSPANKLLLYMFVPFYSIYWIYKSAQRIDKMAAEKGLNSELSTLCLILAIFIPFIALILMQDKINAIATANGTSQGAGTSALKNCSQLDAADELKKYKDLLDSGVITQEEFDAKKKQLLGL